MITYRQVNAVRATLVRARGLSADPEIILELSGGIDELDAMIADLVQRDAEADRYTMEFLASFAGTACAGMES